MNDRIREIPIHLVFGFHGDAGNLTTIGLQSFRSSLSGPLEQSQVGKVLVLMEFANHTKKEGEVLVAQLHSGFKPSLAIVTTLDSYYRNRLPEDEYEAMKKKDFADNFHLKFRRVLDETYEQYQGRVDILPEWSPDDEISSSFSLGNLLTRKFFYLQAQQNYHDAFNVFREAVTFGADSAKKREERLADSLKQRLSEDPDIIAVRGYLGQAHTGLFILLKQEGFQATRTLISSPGTLTFGRLGSVIRYRRFFPEREFTESDWTRAYRYVTGVDIEA